VACGLDILGDKWTLLVVRDLMLGAERFGQMTASPEAIPTNLLAERLVRLSSAGIIEPKPASDGSRHPAYRLTQKGRALGPVLKSLRDWGLAWEKGTRVMAAR
jgi:DNA-binding HxlR family transcriptional regulator